MRRQLFFVLASTALTAALSCMAAAQEYSDGGHGAKCRGPATLTPVEAYGVHPPGWTAPGVCCRQRQTYIPYYAPLAPTPTFVRYAPKCYFPLMPYYTPYYCGYCPHRLHTPKPPPYGWDGWGPGPMPGPAPDVSAGPVLKYGPYTSVVQDDTIFWNMGGNGLVPYGTPHPPHQGPPDLVDMIQSTRAGGAPGGPACHDGATAPASDETGPAIAPPNEKAEEKEAPLPRKEKKKESSSSEEQSDPPK